MGICDHWSVDPPGLHFKPQSSIVIVHGPPRFYFETLKFLNFDFNAEPDPGFHRLWCGSGARSSLQNNANPDPASKNNADPDPASINNADPDPASINNADPDPASELNADLDPASINDADPDPASKNNADPDPASKNYADPDP